MRGNSTIDEAEQDRKDGNNLVRGNRLYPRAKDKEDIAEALRKHK